MTRVKPGRFLFLLLPAVLLAACMDGGHSSAQQKSAGKTYINKNYGIAIRYPADFHASSGFSHGYLQNGSWKTYAGPKSKGQPIVALTLAKSNQVTDAELRIGASRDSQAVATCMKPSDGARPESPGHAVLDGVNFVTFDAGDAAMSHYLDVKSYRAVHDGTCYAIDLLVYGTNPQVYDPPRKPPFTHSKAFARLHAALEGFRFTD
ncbi:MAG: hypothetical protein ACRES9_11505 [Gammaproteobacteria bacterium]